MSTTSSIPVFPSIPSMPNSTATPAVSSVEKVIHKTGNSPFSIHHTQIGPGEKNTLYVHYHPDAEFLYLEQGTMDFIVDNTHYILDAGDAIFVPPGLIHSATKLGDVNTTCSFNAVVFSVEFLESASASTTVHYFAPIHANKYACTFLLEGRNPEHVLFFSHLFPIFRFYQADPAHYELAAKGFLMVCWQDLYNLHLCHLEERIQTDDFLLSLQKAQNYIMEHYEEALTLSQLTTLSGFSESYFCHSFKKFSGYTPFEYLNRVRIMNSLEYLSNTHKKITEIATLCGFNNISYFNRTFMKIMGVTPKEFRLKK